MHGQYGGPHHQYLQHRKSVVISHLPELCICEKMGRRRNRLHPIFGISWHGVPFSRPDWMKIHLS